ncbi:MAG: adenylosuccinate lyase, partial [Candidatus Omnitrophica bacterium]|nr:adenylosuccinate lyase [Candidatus Omnitrophota bacterium]
MIKRYTLPGMAKIWTDENRFTKMLEVEILACEALARQKIIPPADLARIRKRAKFSVKRIDQIEKKTK